MFGPGSYLKRLFWSHLLCVVVGLGHLAGLIMLAWDIGTGSDIFWEPIKYFIIGIAPVSLAAQLPFWFFRFFFGWQFTYGLSPPAESFSLRDIFVFTFVAALGFAGPQMAINLASKPDWFDPTTTYEQVTQPDGTVEWEEVVLTDQKIIDEKIVTLNARIGLEFCSGMQLQECGALESHSLAYRSLCSYSVPMIAEPAVV